MRYLWKSWWLLCDFIFIIVTVFWQKWHQECVNKIILPVVSVWLQQTPQALANPHQMLPAISRCYMSPDVFWTHQMLLEVTRSHQMFFRSGCRISYVTPVFSFSAALMFDLGSWSEELGGHEAVASEEILGWSNSAPLGATGLSSWPSIISRCSKHHHPPSNLLSQKIVI